MRRVFFYGIILPVFVCCLGILFLGNKMIFVGCWEQELKLNSNRLKVDEFVIFGG